MDFLVRHFIPFPTFDNPQTPNISLVFVFLITFLYQLCHRFSP